MNANIPPLKVWIKSSYLTGDDQNQNLEAGYAFAIQSYKGRALQFHVLFESGAHFRHIPLHWLYHTQTGFNPLPLDQLQLWDCFSYKPIVTCFDFLRDYSCNAILRDKSVINATYYATVDWLPDSDCESGVLLHPDQNKCAHLLLLDNGQIGCLPTNRVTFKDAFFIGNLPDAATRKYKTLGTIFKAESCERWSVANTEETFY